MSAFNKIVKQMNQADWSGGQADGLTSNWGKTLTFQLEPTKHLEEICLFVKFTTGAGQTAKNLVADGCGAFLKNFKFEFNEDGQAYPIVDVSGQAMLSLEPQLTGFENAFNVAAKGVSALAASTSYGAMFRWTWNDPRFEEPGAYRTLIPLARARGTKPTITITLPAITEITSDASAVVPHATYVGIEVVGYYVLRDIPDPNNTYPYWRTAAKTYEFAASSVARTKPRFTIERGGCLTGLLQHNYSSSTARGSVLTEPIRADTVKFIYGQRQMEEWREYQLRTRGDRSKVYATAGPMSGEANTLFWDFVSDETLGQTLLLASAPELTTAALDGGECYLEFSNVPANASSKITVFKLRESKNDLLNTTI